jgi:hypothetical protein
MTARTRVGEPIAMTEPTAETSGHTFVDVLIHAP